jgi:hypothetical protein
MEQDKFNKLLYYFPYNLTFYGGGDIWTWTYCGHNRDGSIGLHGPIWHTTVLIDEIGLGYIPILVPFDKIIDYEIDIDGGKMWLCELLANYNTLFSSNSIKEYFETIKWMAFNGHFSFNVMELFFKYHVDVFGLVDLGLAVDYFKLKN